jgi:hypothetical protein
MPRSVSARLRRVQKDAFLDINGYRFETWSLHQILTPCLHCPIGGMLYRLVRQGSGVLPSAQLVNCWIHSTKTLRVGKFWVDETPRSNKAIFQILFGAAQEFMRMMSLHSGVTMVFCSS